MQPYFFPYPAYFSLMAHVDEFVIFDCVQFRRRGRIHRTEVPGPMGTSQWLTLPIAHSPRETLIRDIHFAEGARDALDERLAGFGWMKTAAGDGAQALRDYLAQPLGSFNDFLEQGLRLAAALLRITPRISRSSSLGIPPALHGQDRVLAVVKAMAATRYVNLPGGRDFYEPAVFAKEGIELAFVPEYHGPNWSMLHSLMVGDLEAAREDVMSLLPQPLV